MNQKVISCRVASAVVALEVIFLGKNHSNREAQCLVRKDMGPWTIIIAVATPVPDSQHKQTNKHLHFMKNCIRPHYEKLKPLKSGFIENSNFENNRDPCLVRSREGLTGRIMGPGYS